MSDSRVTPGTTEPSPVKPPAADPAGGAVTPLDWNHARRFLLGCIRHRLDRESRDLHEDLTQIALVRLLRASRKEPLRNPDAFMNRIADNVVVDHLRWRRRWRLLLGPMEPSALAVAGGARPDAARAGDPLERLRFLVLEYFTTEHAPCAELARAYFAGEAWKGLAERRGVPHNTLIKQWSRCVDRLRSAVLGDASPLLGWSRE